MDNGSTLSYLITSAFKALIQFLEMYFMRFPRLVKNTSPTKANFDLCYEWKPPLGFKDLPTLTFHFENAHLDSKPQDAFITFQVDQNVVLCLGFFKDKVRSLIGSFRQVNYRFIHDLKGAKNS